MNEMKTSLSSAVLRSRLYGETKMNLMFAALLVDHYCYVG
jgi:hypothetical protein